MNVLEFANPNGWLWALLAIPIALFYILKIRMRRQQVPTLLFWDRLFNEKKPRAWWQRLRHLLSLLLQLAFLSLLVGALVDPLWSWQKRHQRQIVLVVDNSASMRAIEENERTRLDVAKDSARTLVRSLRDGDQMAILLAGGQPRVAMGMTDHQRSLLAAIESVVATDGPTEVVAAVSVAERLLAEPARPGEIVVLSDGCFEDIEQLKLNPKVKIYGVGQPQDNVGITRYQVRRNLVDPIAYQVLIDVTNFSDDVRSCRVELNLEDELMDVIPLTLPAGETRTRIVDHTSVSGGRLIATLDVDDALAADNTAVALLPQRTKLPVVLVSQGNVFLQGVLDSIPLVDLTIVTEVPAAAPGDGILVLDSTVPARLPRGKVIAVNPQGSCDLWALGESIAEPVVAAVDPESPLTQHVRLDSVVFPDARLLRFATEFQSLIRDALDQPLLARLRRPAGDVVVLTGSLEKGDLPLRIAFPVLMKNTVEWFQRDSGELRPAVSTGSLVALTMPSSGATAAVNSDDASGTGERPGEAEADSGHAMTIVQHATAREDFVLVSPSDRQFPVTLSDQPSLVGPLLETGLWTLRPANVTDNRDRTTAPGDNPTGTTRRHEAIRLACNLANPTESNLRPRADLGRIGAQHLLALGGHSMWFYLTLCAAMFIVLEWWLYQRRIVG